MKRLLGVLVVIALVGLAAEVRAGKMEGAKAKPKIMTLKGEVVDMGCYSANEGAKGEGHKECATKCIAGGMPMGLLTAKGKLYLLTLNHDNPDPFNKCKDMAAAVVEVTGPVMERGGIASIEVTDVKPAMAAAAK